MTPFSARLGAMSSPEPPQRIGDAERDRAVELLRENLALGRLDQAEFDERLEAALSARYADDLTPLFVDLPKAPTSAVAQTGQVAPATSSTPASGGNASSRGNRGILSPPARSAIEAVSWVIWPIMIGLITWAGWGNFWWLIFVPIALSSAWRAYRQHDRNGSADQPTIERDRPSGDNDEGHQLPRN